MPNAGFGRLVLSSTQKALLIVLFLVVAVAVIGTVWPIGPDYFYTFRPATLSFLEGRTRLFDANSPGYYMAPWAVFLLAPTMLLPVSYGEAIFLVAAIVGQVGAVKVLCVEKPPSVFLMALAVVNLHTFDLWLRGNVDGLSILGVALGWAGISQRRPLLLGAGLWLLTIKPVNVMLAGWILLLAMRGWTHREKLLALVPLGLTLLLSFFVFGIDWPWRYIQFSQSGPPATYLQTSLWRAFEFVGLARQIAYVLFLAVLGIALLTIKRASPNALLLALAANLTFSPYALGSHYVLLAPVFVQVALAYPWGALTWLLTLTPLLRLIWGFEVAWIDNLYPAMLMIGMLALVIRERAAQRAAQPKATLDTP